MYTISLRLKERTKKSGNPYVAVHLFDGIKEITVNFFDWTQERLAEKGIEKNSIIKIRLTNFLSGLLYHTQRMVSMALKVCETYPALDKELLVCGTALRDIGKVTCYETQNVGKSEITVTGRLLDHAVVGILMVEEAAKSGIYHAEKLQMLEHMIASHHGKNGMRSQHRLSRKQKCCT